MDLGRSTQKQVIVRNVNSLSLSALLPRANKSLKPRKDKLANYRTKHTQNLVQSTLGNLELWSDLLLGQQCSPGAVSLAAGDMSLWAEKIRQSLATASWQRHWILHTIQNNLTGNVWTLKPSFYIMTAFQTCYSSHLWPEWFPVESPDWLRCFGPKGRSLGKKVITQSTVILAFQKGPSSAMPEHRIWTQANGTETRRET